MKKTIMIGLILLLLPIVIADIEIPEVQPYTPPSNKMEYFLKISVPEAFGSMKSFFNKDERVNYKIEQLQKRQIELQALLEKIQTSTSEANKKRYGIMIEYIIKRMEKNAKQLDKYSSLLRKEKRDIVVEQLRKRDEVLNNLKNKFTELGNTNALKGIENAISQSDKIKERLNKTTQQSASQRSDSTDVMQDLGEV